MLSATRLVLDCFEYAPCVIKWVFARINKVQLSFKNALYSSSKNIAVSAILIVLVRVAQPKNKSINQKSENGRADRI